MRLPLVRGLAIYLVLPNLAFFLVGKFIFLLRPLVNADYLVAWIASRYMSRGATVALYCVLLVLDFVLSGSSIYNFSTADVILNAHYLAYLNPYIVYPAVAGLLLFLAAVIIFNSKTSETATRQSGRIQVALILATTAFFSMSIAHSMPTSKNRFERISKPMIVDSRVAEIAEWGVDTMLGDENHGYRYTEVASTTRVLWRDLSLSGSTAPPYNVVLILVESEGLLENADDLHRIFEPLINSSVKARYAISSGTVPFEGATLSGELRALCRIRAWEANVLDAKTLPPCLPKLLREHGYETMSFHGNTGKFFDRPPWYSALGFQHSYFAEELVSMVAEPLVSCGNLFKGVCDLGIVDVIRRELKTPIPKKKFIYWLTYNSHLPVDSELARQSSFDCGHDRDLGAHPDPCNLARIHYQLHQSIARLAMDADLPPTRFIVVGDHMPPFATLAERKLYNERHVPFVDLIPRKTAAAIAAQTR